MADVSLLFDVAGGGSLSGESGSLISSQLASIVNAINATPLEIKFKANEQSLSDIRETVQKITESFGDIHVGNLIVDSNSGTKGTITGIDQITSSAKQASAAVSGITASLEDSAISKIKETLRQIDGLGNNTGAVDSLATAINKVGIVSGTIETNFKRVGEDGQRLVSLIVNGKNELGGALKYLFTYDAETQEIKETAIKIKGAFGKATKELNKSTTIGESIETARDKIKSLLEDMRSFEAKANGSGAKVSLGGERVDVSEGLKKTMGELEVYGKETLSADTSQKSFNNTLNDFRTRFKSIKTAVSTYNDELSRLNKENQENLQDTNSLSKAIVATSRAYKQGTEAVQKYTAAKRGRSSKEYADIERATSALSSLNERLNSGAVSQTDYIRETNRLRAIIQQSTATIKANGEAHLSLQDRMKMTARRFGQFFTVAKLAQTVWRSLRQMVSASIELDNAFTQLKIVTGATDAEMKEFSATAIELSKNLGQSVADVTKSIETFSRLGYNLPDASALAEYATILANTASVSTEEATTGLTSIIKGFNLDVSDAEHVADVLIEVGQKYAVSAGEMMEAYERSGAALNATNTSFEKSAGLIAAANASVQDSSTVGTALKTVSARIRGSKSDLEELGEDTTDLADGFSKYAEELKSLTGFDIMVKGSKTEFKDLYDIMEGVAKVWDTLSGTSQARVAEILGGTRQLQVISSIIGNWGDAAGAFADAMDSAGVATEANNTYMESTTAHINQFKATFEELSADVMSSNLISAVVDFASTILSALDAVAKLSDTFGTLPTIATALAAALSFKNVGRDKMSSLFNRSNMPTVIDFC